jgi:3D (Asp-Asp-Asp) domain-containing protein
MIKEKTVFFIGLIMLAFLGAFNFGFESGKAQEKETTEIQEVVTCVEVESQPMETEPTTYEETTEETTESEFTSLGVFEVTAYCGCEKCCGKSDGITATGTKAEEGRTIAVDPDVIPYGTVVMINGQEYVAEDCGGAVNGNVVDIYFDNHADALQYGRQTHEIHIRG